jgi:hypothetical protein
MKKNQRKSSIDRKTALVAGLIIICLLAVGMFVVHRNAKNVKSPQIIGTDGQKVTLTPATPQEKRAADDHKSSILQKDEAINKAEPDNTPVSASLVITEASSTSVRAYISGVYEDGGSCTATAVQGSQKVTASSVGFKNVSYTQCPSMTWSSPLSGGAWTVKVTYKSNTAEITETKNISI